MESRGRNPRDIPGRLFRATKKSEVPYTSRSNGSEKENIQVEMGRYEG
jgi:hypothetical protein